MGFRLRQRTVIVAYHSAAGENADRVTRVIDKNNVEWYNTLEQLLN